MKYVIFSGIQPTGKITLGNYLGVIKQWVNYQTKYDYYDCYFTIADLHAITSNQEFISDLVLDTLSIYLACGIDYNKSTIFLQSQVSEHTQLNWILNSFTSVGELKNMIQFKTKRILLNNNNNKFILNAALLNYPILMSADILLYNTNYVPVGKDQKQHLELTQKIAHRFNYKYKQNIFNIPLPIISHNCNKIMSLTNPRHKMSKSDSNIHSWISLLDSYELIRKKITISITDNDNPAQIYYDPIKKPGITNLLNILNGLTNIDIPILENKLNNWMYKDLKQVIIDNIYLHLNNIQRRYVIYRKQENFLKEILLKGAHKARAKAKLMMKQINYLVGLINN